MDLPSGTATKFALLFLLSICALILKFVLDSRRAGLSHIPGPFLARYTDLWRFYQAVKGFGKRGFLPAKLETYGEVVRVGPTTVAVFDPAAIPTIYGTGSRLNKVRVFLIHQKEFRPFLSISCDTLYSALLRNQHSGQRAGSSPQWLLTEGFHYDSSSALCPWQLLGPTCPCWSALC